MWRPAINSLVRIRHPDERMAQLLKLASKGEDTRKFRIERLVDYPSGDVEAILQPEHGTHPLGHTHTLYTSWLVPADQPD